VSHIVGLTKSLIAQQSLGLVHRMGVQLFFSQVKLCALQTHSGPCARAHALGYVVGLDVHRVVQVEHIGYSPNWVSQQSMGASHSMGTHSLTLGVTLFSTGWHVDTPVPLGAGGTQASPPAQSPVVRHASLSWLSAGAAGCLSSPPQAETRTAATATKKRILVDVSIIPSGLGPGLSFPRTALDVSAPAAGCQQFGRARPDFDRSNLAASPVRPDGHGRNGPPEP
jgi:hypothetical protein